MEIETIVKLIEQLGVPIVVLGFCGWYIKFLQIGINYPAASSGVFFDAFEKSLAKLWPAALKNAASCGE